VPGWDSSIFGLGVASAPGPEPGLIFIERLEEALEKTTAKAEGLEMDLSAERQAGEEKAEKVTALTIENTRLEEQVKAAQGETVAMRKALDAANMERERECATHERDREGRGKEPESVREAAKEEREQAAERLAQEKAARERLQQERDAENSAHEHDRGQREKEIRELRQGWEDLQEQIADLKTANARLKERVNERLARSPASEICGRGHQRAKTENNPEGGPGEKLRARAKRSLRTISGIDGLPGF